MLLKSHVPPVFIRGDCREHKLLYPRMASMFLNCVSHLTMFQTGLGLQSSNEALLELLLTFNPVKLRGQGPRREKDLRAIESSGAVHRRWTKKRHNWKRPCRSAHKRSLLLWKLPGRDLQTSTRTRGASKARPKTGLCTYFSGYTFSQIGGHVLRLVLSGGVHRYKYDL